MPATADHVGVGLSTVGEAVGQQHDSVEGGEIEVLARLRSTLQPVVVESGRAAKLDARNCSGDRRLIGSRGTRNDDAHLVVVSDD